MENYDRFIGQIFEKRYTVLNIIGIGGMAVVFGVYDSVTSRTVALKMLKNDLMDYSTALAQFLNESKMLSRLSHPNIVGLHDIPPDSHADRRLGRYFTMEFVESITLKQHLAAHPILPTDEILHYISQVLAALEHMHEKEIIHGDIKPDNILLCREGLVKLTDFGIAHHRDDPRLSNGDEAVGTVYYVSPEQAEGKPYDSASDLYSLGITMYEMACGALPFCDDDPTAVARMHIQEEFPDPARQNRAIPHGLSEIIRKATRKNPEERFASAAEMLAAVKTLQSDPRHVFDFDKPPKKELSLALLLEKLPRLPRLGARKAEAEPTEPPRRRWETLTPRVSALLGIASSFALVFAVTLIVVLIKLFSVDRALTTLRIPDLVGQAYIGESERVLDPDFYDIRIVYRPDDSHTFGTVLEQSPAPGTRIKIADGEGERCDITLVLSVIPEEVLMEDYSVMSADEAVAALTRRGFSVKLTECTHPTIREGLVCRTHPAAGESILTGEEVEIFVSIGEEIVKLAMPPLVGKDESEAIAYLLSCGLLPGKVSYMRSDLPAGVVLTQSIPAGDEVIAGASRVDLTVSGGPDYKQG